MMIDRRALLTSALGASMASWAGPARAEVSEVHIVRQFGIGYLPLTIMLHEKLVEKHAAKAGLSLTTKWSVLGNAVPINDGLIAGTIHVGSGGIAPMVIAWDKTRGSVDIKGIGALCALPIFLVGRHPYKSVKEFTDQDRISMAGAGQSIQTMYLQMEVAKVFGIAEYKKLNPLFVNLSHPDGLAALLSGQQITASFLATVSIPRPRKGHAQDPELLRRDGWAGVVPFGLVHQQVPYGEPQCIQSPRAQLPRRKRRI